MEKMFTISLATIILMLSLLVVPQTLSAAEAETLTPKREKIAAIAAFTARGDIPQLKRELAAGLDAGLTVNEIKEILMQMYAYCGFPRSLNGIGAFTEVVEERKANGIRDNEGSLPTPFEGHKSKYRIGMEIQTTLAGVPVPVNPFAPEMDAFLKEHLFCDLIARDNMNLIDREIATVAALAAMSGTEGQLAFHKGALARVGLLETEVEKVVKLVSAN